MGRIVYASVGKVGRQRRDALAAGTGDGWHAFSPRTRRILPDILARAERGETYAAIGARYELSRQRIHQLVRLGVQDQLADERASERRALGQLIRELPPIGTPWPKTAREAWLRRLAAQLDRVYGDD